MAWQIANYCSVSIWNGGKALPDIKALMSTPSSLDEVVSDDVAEELKLLKILSNIKGVDGNSLIKVKDYEREVD